MKKCLNPLYGTYCFLILFAILITSCEKSDDNFSSGATTVSTLKTTVSGKVTDESGNIMSGVMVHMGNITTVTDSLGYFLFVNKDVPKNRITLKAEKPGFFNCIKSKKTQNGAANYINMVMEPLPAVVNVSGTSGGVVNVSGGATITFPVNSFVDGAGNAYTGQVQVYARHFSPGDDNFESIVPGGDLLGINSSGEEQSLFSLGMIETKLYDNTGNEIQLAPGKTAELVFPIHPSQNSVAQNTIPMWHLDEETGIWMEEGQAVKSGTNYIATVSHFSTWNCDYSGERTDIEGKVVDCENNPMPNIVVTINGFMDVITDNSGSFTTWVPAGYVIDCQVLQINNPFLTASSPVQSITAVAGQMNIVPTLIIPCVTRITGIITNCAGTALIPGIVYVSWSSGGQTIYTSQYTSTGNYEIFVPEITNITLNVYNSGLTGSQSVQSGTTGTLTNAPDIQLCNSTPIGTNSFTITENGIPINYTFNNITSEYALFDDINYDGNPDNVSIWIQGTVIPGNIPCTFSLDIADLVIGEMNYSLFISQFVDISLGSNYYHNYIVSFTSTNNIVQFLDFGIPGTQCYGTYEFDSGDYSQVSGAFSATHVN